MERLVEGLGRARERAAALHGAVAEPVVENSVGAGTQLCSTFEDLGEVARRGGVRVCVDTAHAFVAGYDLSAESGGRMVAEDLVDAVGGAIALVHLNDAKHELGSHRDGHRKVGEGRIPSTPGQGFSTVCQEFPWSWRRLMRPLRLTPKRCFWSRSWQVGCAKRRLDDRI